MRNSGNCLTFLLDYEDEIIAEEEVSCYNCRYRRWTESSFVCMRVKTPAAIMTKPATGHSILDEDEFARLLADYLV